MNPNNAGKQSPVPFFILTALLGLVPVLNNKYPAQFFPALSPDLVSILCVALGTIAAYLGLTGSWSLLVKRTLAREMIRQARESRHADPKASVNDVDNSGRLISRLVRNVDEDLLEIRPDFSESSLKRLQRYLPVLLLEIEKEEDARIRLGIVGTYLGETACRNAGWQWVFKADPALRQFSYLASALGKGGREMDPYAWAGEILEGKKKIGAWLEVVR